MPENIPDISPTKIYVGKADVSGGKYHPKDVGRIKDIAVAQEAANKVNQSYGGIKDPKKREEAIDRFLAGSRRIGRGFDPFHLEAAAKAREEKQSKHFEDLSKRDSLTGLLNQESLTATMNEMKKRNKPYGVARGDLDMFSWVNDKLGGHEFGNLYLQLLARTMTDNIQ